MNKIKSSKSDLVFDIIVTLIVVGVLLVVAYPLYFILIASFSNASLVSSGQVVFFPKDMQIDGFMQVLQDSQIWIGYANTIIYTLFGTLIAVAMTITAGYALSRNDLVGRKFFMGIYLFIMYVNGGLIPTYLIIKDLNLLDTHAVMILVGSFSVFNLIITRTFFMSKFPPEFFEAARIDGCGNGKYFTHIVLPLAKDVISILVLYYGVAKWNSYFEAMIYLTDENKFPLQLILKNLLLSAQSLSSSSDFSSDIINEIQRYADSVKYTIIIVSSLPILCLYPFLQKYFVKGIMIGGVKG